MSISVVGHPAMRSCQRQACQRFGRHRQPITTAREMRGVPSTCCSHQSRRASSSRFVRSHVCRSVEFTRLELDASGTVGRKDGVTRFTEIVLRPRLTVPAGTNRERMLQILEKSEKTCLVSASLSTPLRLEPEVNEA